MKPIAFIDLAAQQAHIGSKIQDGIHAVLAHGKYIMGPEVAELEGKLCEFSGAKHAVSCSNGTDAITMTLMAWGIGPGDAVLCPSFTFASTAETVALTGASPIFVDIDEDTFNVSVESLRQAINETKARGDLTLRAIIAVDLFGQIANYPALREIADQHDLKIIADAAQGFGSTLNGKQAIEWADAVTTSFFPAKPLGCYGDGGAVLSNDDELVHVMKSIRVHGKGGDKYDNIRIGLNARLDTIQAAVLLPKLEVFAEEIEKRNVVAKRYKDGLSDHAKTPFVPEGYISTWAQYTLTVNDRDSFTAALKEHGIPTAVYYPKPLHQQTAYKHYPSVGNGLPVSDRLAHQVVSLPMHPYLEEEQQDYIIEHVTNALRG